MTKPAPCEVCGFASGEWIATLAVSDLCFVSDHRFPGRCVITLHPHATELFELGPEILSAYADDVSRAAKAIKLATDAFKMNYEILGNADPHALTLATNCFTAVDYIGMPEARIVLSQTATYLASSPKSNASYRAIEEASADVAKGEHGGVPLHLRNAPTKFMKELDYGKEYKYGHGYTGNFVEQQYLPDNIKDKIYYHPTENGNEASIRRRLQEWWKGKKR